MHVLLVSEDSDRMVELHDRLRHHVSTLKVTCVESCWEACRELGRTDVEWVLVVVVWTSVRLVSVAQMCDPMQDDVAAFIKGRASHSGVLVILEYAQAHHVVPQRGIVCGYDADFHGEMAPRIADAGGTPIRDDYLFSTCVRYVRSLG